MASGPTQTVCATPVHTRGGGPAAAAQGSVELRRLQRNLLHAVTTSPDKDTMLAAIGAMVRESTNLLATRYYGRDGAGQLAPTWQSLYGNGKQITEDQHRRLLACCQTACLKGQLQLDADGDQLLAVSVPVFLRQRAPEALAFLLPKTARLVERTIVKLQLVATHVTLWHVLGESHEAERETRKTAALLEVVEKLAGCDDLQHACYTLVSQLKDYLKWDHVAVGVCRGRRQECSLQALSGCARFDRNSDRTRAIEAALDEALLRGTLSQWPTGKTTPRHATRALARLHSITNSALAVSGPLRDEQGDSVGAWLFLADQGTAEPESSLRFIRAAEHAVGACLRLVERAGRGAVGRLGRRLAEARKAWQTRALLAAACLLAVVLAVPVPYKVKADCEVQPLTRRFVAAPFDGRLEKALVEPSDVISKGDVLARIDGRDIRWELAGLIADYGRATKRRDVALAGHDVVTAQLAKLEMEKLQLNMKMLDDRVDNLEIKSPIDGIVISGDQERSEGAPLTVGQALFEIAPLDRVVIEIAIPEEEIQFVQNGLEAVVHLDTYPRHDWRGTICTLHPRSESKDDRNVFVAEVRLDNPHDRLRPGMSGRAEVITGRHPLAWNLLHKPCESVLSWLGW